MNDASRFYRVPEKPEFLYHGSSERFDVILPSQAYDWGYKEGRRNAVYATSKRDIALAFALGIVPDENGQTDRVMDYKYTKDETVMLYVKGHPNFGGKGYVYKLSSKGFSYAGGTQWVSPVPVHPLEITETNVDDYAHLWRYPTDEERQQIEENFRER
jgi:hypothetical protein